MRVSIFTGALSLVVLLAGCAGLTGREQRILGGAAIGGAIGNVVTDGSVGGTVGGAVIGGALGSQLDGDERYRTDRDYRRRMDDCLKWYTYRYCADNIRR